MTIYNWLTLFGIPGLLAGFAAFLRLQVRQNRAVKDGLRAILRDRLLQAFHHCAARGFADSDDRQNFENMYVQYHSLGGNGVMENLRQKFFDLPLQPLTPSPDRKKLTAPQPSDPPLTTHNPERSSDL